MCLHVGLWCSLSCQLDWLYCWSYLTELRCVQLYVKEKLLTGHLGYHRWLSIFDRFDSAMGHSSFLSACSWGCFQLIIKLQLEVLILKTLTTFDALAIDAANASLLLPVTLQEGTQGRSSKVTLLWSVSKPQEGKALCKWSKPKLSLISARRKDSWRFVCSK